MKQSEKRLTNHKVSALLLRVGLAFVFVYAALSSLHQPLLWVGYFPAYMTNVVDGLVLVKLFAILELILAAWLLSGRFVRYAALISAAMLLGIVVFNPHALIITFRDVGLVCMALALALDA